MEFPIRPQRETLNQKAFPSSTTPRASTTLSLRIYLASFQPSSCRALPPEPSAAAPPAAPGAASFVPGHLHRGPGSGPPHGPRSPASGKLLRTRGPLLRGPRRAPHPVSDSSQAPRPTAASCLPPLGPARPQAAASGRPTPATGSPQPRLRRRPYSRPSPNSPARHESYRRGSSAHTFGPLLLTRSSQNGGAPSSSAPAPAPPPAPPAAPPAPPRAALQLQSRPTAGPGGVTASQACGPNFAALRTQASSLRGPPWPAAPLLTLVAPPHGGGSFSSQDGEFFGAAARSPPGSPASRLPGSPAPR